MVKQNRHRCTFLYLLHMCGAILLCAILAPALLHAQPCPVAWGPTQQISSTPSSAYVPKLAVVGDTVHVVYSAGATYYQRSTNGGIAWSTETVVIPTDSGPGPTTLAAYRNNVYTTWRNTTNELAPINIRQSTDGGETWLKPQVVIRNISAFERYHAPKVSANGAMVYVIANRATGTQQWFLSRSNDYGSTWDSVRQITFSSYGSGFGPLADIRAVGSSVHFTFERSIPPSGREIVYTRSTDQGVTWDSLTVLSTIDFFQAWEPNVAADDSGNVYVSWQDAKYGSIGGFAGTLLLRRSTDNGVTWLPEERIGSLPSVEQSSLTTSSGRVHVAWWDDRFGSLSPRVYYSGRSTQDTLWCEETMLGDSSLVSLDPALGVLQGDVHAAWSMRIPSIAQVHYRHGDVITSITERNQTLPEQFTVTSFYPNPFNPSTRVQYTVPSQGKLTITVYDVLGRKVRELFNGPQAAGDFEIDFDATTLASGVYYVRFQFDTRIITKGVVLIR